MGDMRDHRAEGWGLYRYTAYEITRRYSAQGLQAWSVHPGSIRTGLQQPNLHDAMTFVRCGLMTTLMLMQNASQGAATTVWAAVARDLEGRGGRYLERCQISEPARKGHGLIEPGHAPWAYDEDAARRLWDISLRMVKSRG
jgi:hypothetical protein